MPGLKNKQWELFCQELVSGAPQVVAYTTAYGESPSAPFNASRLAAKPEIQSRIEELRNTVVTYSDRVADKVEWIRSQFYGTFAFDPLALYDPVPGDERALKLKPLAKIPPQVRRHITKIKTDPETDHPTEIAFTDKLAAAGVLLRSLPGGQVERHELTGPGGSPLTITIEHLVTRLMSQDALDRAGPNKLVVLDRVQRDLRLLAADESGEQLLDPEPIEAER